MQDLLSRIVDDVAYKIAVELSVATYPKYA